MGERSSASSTLDRFCTGSSSCRRRRTRRAGTRARQERPRAWPSGRPADADEGSAARQRDNQEDKGAAVRPSTPCSARCSAPRRHGAGTQGPPRAHARRAALQGFATATDLADYLVRWACRFATRTRSSATGRAPRRRHRSRPLADAPRRTACLSDAIGADVFDSLTLEGSLAARCITSAARRRRRCGRRCSGQGSGWRNKRLIRRGGRRCDIWTA